MTNGIKPFLHFILGIFILLFLFRVGFTIVNGVSMSNISLVILPFLRLDVAFVSYFTALLILLLFLLSFLKSEYSKKLILYLFFVVQLSIIAIIELSSILLFSEWGTTLDTRVFSYLGHSEAWSTIYSSLNTPILLAIVLSGLIIHLLSKWWSKQFSSVKRAYLYLFVIPVLIIPARGGLQKIPIDTSVVFTSSDMSQNYLALNKPYHFFKSVINWSKRKKRTNSESSLFVKPEDHPTLLPSEVQNHPKPNLVFLLLEGLPYSLLNAKESGIEITPTLNKLLGQSLSFHNIYSTGFRTDQGLLAIYSGIPALPHINMMNDLEKVHTAPSILKDLANFGYHTSFFYGGDLNFSEMSKYLISQKVKHIVSVKDFEKPNTDWGMQDDAVLDKMAAYLEEESQPFCSNILTLLSHQPFDYQGTRKFGQNTLRNQFLSSAYYLDSLVGHFLHTAKHKTWYDNTIFVIVSDHGSTYTGDVDHNENERFHIPLLVFGEPLNASMRGKSWTTLGGHHDLPQTLSYILKLTGSDYPYSNNLLNPKELGRAFWFTEFEMGYLTDSVQTKLYHQGGKNATHKTNSSLDSIALDLLHSIESEY